MTTSRVVVLIFALVAAIPCSAIAQTSQSVQGVILDPAGEPVSSARVEVAGLDPAVVDHERSVLSEQARGSGKPDEVVAKMVEGRLRKFYAESVLLEQVFVIDGETKVEKALETAAKDAGGPIQVANFGLFILGVPVVPERVDTSDLADAGVSAMGEGEGSRNGRENRRRRTPQQLHVQARALTPR